VSVAACCSVSQCVPANATIATFAYDSFLEMSTKIPSHTHTHTLRLRLRHLHVIGFPPFCGLCVHRVAACCSVLQCVAANAAIATFACNSFHQLLHSNVTSKCRGMLQCVAACCSVSQQKKNSFRHLHVSVSTQLFQHMPA